MRSYRKIVTTSKPGKSYAKTTRTYDVTIIPDARTRMDQHRRENERRRKANQKEAERRRKEREKRKAAENAAHEAAHPTWDKQLYLAQIKAHPESWVSVIERMRRGVPTWDLFVRTLWGEDGGLWNVVWTSGDWCEVETMKQRWEGYMAEGGTYQTWLAKPWT